MPSRIRASEETHPFIRGRLLEIYRAFRTQYIHEYPSHYASAEFRRSHDRKIRQLTCSAFRYNVGYFFPRVFKRNRRGL